MKLNPCFDRLSSSSNNGSMICMPHEIPASIDFATKEILLGKVFVPSGDNKKDIRDLQDYYKVFTARHPEKY